MQNKPISAAELEEYLKKGRELRSHELNKMIFAAARWTKNSLLKSIVSLRRKPSDWFLTPGMFDKS